MAKNVLITGATGYIAGWIIKKLLEQGYNVTGTVRNKSNSKKYEHLTELAKKSEGTLNIVEADLLEQDRFKEIVPGHEIVFHTASPFKIQVKDAQKELIEPALLGTRNVLNAVNASDSVKKVVLTSSVVAIYGDAQDQHDDNIEKLTEENWNKTSTENHQAYSLSKTLAEKEAWEIADSQDRWQLLTINPGFVMGPSLTSRKDSTSIDTILSFLNGKYASGIPDLMYGIVDVRDVAEAHIRAAELDKAKGRHILVNESKRFIELAEILKKQFPQYKLPKSNLPKFLLYIVGPFLGFSWKFINRNVGVPLYFDNSWTKTNLDMDFIPLEQTMIEMVESMKEHGHIG